MTNLNKKILILAVVAAQIPFALGQSYQVGNDDYLDAELQQEIQAETGGSNLRVQPQTNVVASPLSQSRADLLRQRRQDAEVKTEQKIVEKLEESRLKDEAKRANRLFGDRLENQEVEAVQQPQQVVVPVVAVPQEPEVVIDEAALKAEIAAQVKADLESAKDAAKKEKSAGTTYISGLVGVAEYDGLSNVESNIATGFTVGHETDSNFLIEGSFIYSNHSVADDFYAYKDMDQYNFGVGARYLLKLGRVTPSFGGVVSYTYREYGELRSQYDNRQLNSNRRFGNFDDSEDSQAFDVGFIMGLDFEVSESMAIGVDYRMMRNVSNKSNDYGPFDTGFDGFEDREPIEETDYSIFNLSAKIKF